MLIVHARNRLVALIAMFVLPSSMIVCAADPAADAAHPAPVHSAPSVAPSPRAAAQLGLANPASQHCVKLGGALQIRERPDGGQFGVCTFQDNRQCEEWALLRGDCPEGGIKITGYDNQAQIYCAITGGQVDMQTGTCLRADGKRCSLEENFAGRCPES